MSASGDDYVCYEQQQPEAHAGATVADERDEAHATKILKEDL